MMHEPKWIYKLRRLLILLIFFSTAAIIPKRILAMSVPFDKSYYAGVVEMIPAVKGTTKQRLNANKDQILRIIQSNYTKNLDILVFPENILNNMDYRTYLPNPQLGISPCDSPDYDFFLTTLSCAIRSRGLYVVVNLYEKEPCEGGAEVEAGCGSDGMHTFISNIVFDRQGRIISRYRKTHLYRYEWYLTSVLRDPDISYFKTDFGVTFGHLIGFDILFYIPAMRLARDFKITDFIYPTYWFNELPFLTSIQLQEAWAIANDVNLLAADSCIPQEQNTGSGIYAGRMGRIKTVMQQQQKSVILTARVPKRNLEQIPADLTMQQPFAAARNFTLEISPPRFTHLSLLRDYNLDIFATELLPQTRIQEFIGGMKRVCHQTFCCDFTMAVELIKPLVEEVEEEEQTTVNLTIASNGTKRTGSYRYRLAAYSGDGTTFQRIDRSAQSVCAIFTCTGDDLFTCGQIFPSETEVVYTHYFRNLSVSGSFSKAVHRLILPSTLDGQIMPLTVDEYEWTKKTKDDHTTVTINLLTPKIDLLTFGIWANYYTTAVTMHNLQTKKSLQMHPKTAKEQKSSASITVNSVYFMVYIVTITMVFW